MLIKEDQKSKGNSRLAGNSLMENRKNRMQKITAIHNQKTLPTRINNWIGSVSDFYTGVEKDTSSWMNKEALYQYKEKKQNQATTLGTEYQSIVDMVNMLPDGEAKDQYLGILSQGKSALDGFGEGMNGVIELYSPFASAEEYEGAKKDAPEMEKLYAMTTEEIAPYLEDKEHPVAYTTSGGEEILWQDLYDMQEREGMKTANLSELETEIADLELQIEAEENKTKGNAADAFIGWFFSDEEKDNVYGTNIAGLKDKLTAKKAYYNQAKYIQEGLALYDTAINAEDFEKHSGYVSTKQDGFWDRVWSDVADSLPYDDLAYEYINNDDMRGAISTRYATVTSDKGYDYITDEEKAVYNYYYATAGMEKANRYLESIQQDLYKRKATNDFKDYENNTFKELTYGLKAGLNQFGSGIWSLFDNRDYIPVNSTQLTSGMIREDLSDSGFKVGDTSIGQAGYDMISTTSNMLPSILTSAALSYINPALGGVAGSVLLGSSAAGNAYQEMLNLGYDKSQARTYSTLVGASEAGLQYVMGGVGKLSGGNSGVFQSIANKALKGIDNGFARAAITLGSNMLDEGLEESLQEILSPVFQNIALNADNSWSDIDWSQVAYSGVLGALSAGLLEGGGTIAGEVSTYTQGKRLLHDGINVNKLSSLGQTLPADTVAYRLSGKVDENTGAYTIARLFNEVGAELTEQNKADIMKSLIRKGVPRESAETLTAYMAAVVNGVELTEQQAKVLEAETDVAQTMRDVILNPRSTVNQRMQKYAQVGGDGGLAAQVGMASDETVGANSGDYGENSSIALRDGYAATVLGTNEAVEVTGIESVTDGEMVVTLSDGTTMDLADLELADESITAVLSAASAYSTATARAFVDGYDGSMPVDTYRSGFEYIRNQAANGMSYEQAVATAGAIGQQMSERARQNAYAAEVNEAKGTAEDSALQRANESGIILQKEGVQNEREGKSHDESPQTVDERDGGNKEKESNSGRNRTGRKDQESVRRGQTGVSARRGVNDPSLGEEPHRTWAKDGSVSPQKGTVAYAEQQVAVAYGVPSFVVTDEVFDQHHAGAPAFAAGGQIYFRQNIETNKRGMVAEHEINHVMRQVGYAPYLEFLDILPETLQLHEEAAINLFEGISRHTGIDLFSATQEEMVSFFDELNATVYSHIAVQDTAMLDVVRPAFMDFGAYVADITDIHRRFKESRTGSMSADEAWLREETERVLSGEEDTDPSSTASGPPSPQGEGLKAARDTGTRKPKEVNAKAQKATGRKRYVPIAAETKNALREQGVSKTVLDGLDAVAKAIDRQVVPYYSQSSENGYKRDGIIYVNMRSKNSRALFTVGHELTHILEKSDRYAAMKSFVLNSRWYEQYLQNRGLTHEQLIEETIQAHAEHRDADGNLDPDLLDKAGAEQEIVADMMGTMLFQNADMVKKLRGYNVRLFNTVRNFVEKITAKLNHTTAAGKELMELRQMFRQVMWDAEKAEKAGKQGQKGKQRYSISSSFYQQLDGWDGKNPSITFTIGETSQALQSIGVKNQEIKMRSGMMLSKMNKHAEITLDTFRQIPALLERPVIVQFSDALDPKTGKPKYDSRITVLGELYADMDVDGQKVSKPVLVSMELLPTNQKGTTILDFSVVTSAYAKQALQGYINDNSILYIDPNKKRTDNWLSLNRLQLPVGENQYGSVRKITYDGGKVKIQHPKNKTAMQAALEKAGVIDSYGTSISKKDTGDTDKRRLSMSKTTDADWIAQAEALERQGKGREEIWQETGLVRDASGVWVYEIDDSQLKTYPKGNAPGGVAGTLSQYVRHDDLFHRYPALKTIGLDFALDQSRANGAFDAEKWQISLAPRYKALMNTDMFRETVLHEIQHAMQYLDGRDNGSNPLVWMKRDQDRIREIVQGFSAENRQKYARLQALSGEIDAIIDSEAFRKNRQKAVDAYFALEDEYEQIHLALHALPEYRELLSLKQDLMVRTEKYHTAYENTAGELEARETENRQAMTAEERREKTPNLGWDRAVLAEDSGESYAIGYTTDNQPVAIIDEDILSSVPKTDWVKTVKRVIAERFKNGVPVGGRLIKVNRITRNEYTNSKYSKFIRDNSGHIYADKFKSANNLDDIVLASTNYVNEDLKHERNDNFKEFARGEAFVRVGKNDYKATVIVGFTTGHQMVLYDVIDFVPTQLKIKKEGTPYGQHTNEAIRSGAPSNTTVTQNSQDVNISVSEKGKKYSISPKEKMDALVEEYGAIPKGEKPTVDVQVPQKTSENRRVRRFVRTVLESGILTDEMVQDVDQAIIDEALSYEVVTDKATEAEVDRILARGVDHAWHVWEEAIADNKLPDKKHTVLGETLLRAAAEKGDAAAVMQTIAELAEAGTRAGQAVQAQRMLKKMTGVGQLLYVQRTVNRLNRDIEERNSKRSGKHQIAEVEINENLALELAEAKTEQEAERVADLLLQDVADQVDSTFLDKWNAWRYLSMLGNPRTHIRNLLGNTIFLPAVRMKDALAIPLEKALVKQGGTRTKVLRVEQAYREFAQQDFAEMQEFLTGNGKYNPADPIRDRKRVFKSEVLETLRKTNSWMLEAEDALFLRRHYVHALGSYLQANHVDLEHLDERNPMERSVLNAAREYALREAQKATYRDESALADTLANMSKQNMAANILVEGILPFKKTPINILKRGVEYSPAGLMWTIARGTQQLRQGRITMTEYIDGLAAGLTGTGIVALGMFLASMGLIGGGLGDDDEDEFAKLQGEQAYSIRIGDLSYTIDWMAPATIPLFIGVELMNAIQGEHGNVSFADVADVLSNMTEPMVETSMLSGISNLIDSVSYGENSVDKFSTAILETVSSYVQQGIPTILGQLARTIDGTRRKIYIDKDMPLPSSVQYTLQKIRNKIPGLSFLGEPYVDEWGREDTTDNVLVRAFQNFVSPGYISTIDGGAVEEELQRLYDATGEGSVLPSMMDKYITIDGERVNLSAEEYTVLATTCGQTAYGLLEKVIADDEYQALSDVQKSAVVEGVYDLAKAVAKQAVSDYEPDGWVATALEMNQTSDIPLATYLVYHEAAKELQADVDEEGNAIFGSKKEKVVALIDSMNLTPEQKDALYLADYAESGLRKTPWH